MESVVGRLRELEPSGSRMEGKVVCERRYLAS